MLKIVLKSPKAALITILATGLIIVALVFLWSDKAETNYFEKMKVYNVIFGPGGSPLNHPSTVAVGIDGRLFVADDSKMIAVFEENGRYLYSFSGPGTGLAELGRPASMAVGPDGSLYVADPEKQAVIVFSSSGEYRTRVAGEKQAGFKPTGITTAGEEIHVFNEKDRSFYSFRQKDKKLKKMVPGEDNQTKFNLCGDLVRDPETGLVWSVDLEKGQVVVSKDGKYKQAFGDEYLQAPGGIAFDRSNKLLFVSDTVKNRIVVFNYRGDYIGQFGTAGDDKNSFNFPEGLAMDQRGKLYVADRGNNRVVIYEFR